MPSMFNPLASAYSKQVTNLETLQKGTTMSESSFAYLVVQLNVKNHQEYIERYAMHVLPMFKKHGAEVIAASAPKVLEGAWEGNWSAVVRFPSMSAAEEWYNSAEYKPLKELRKNELTEGGSSALVEGFNPPVRN
jgi:uncharacterized protein (DUF1330 family)